MTNVDAPTEVERRRLAHLPLGDLPEGWKVVRTSGPALFITHALLERPDGTEVEWTSRRHRKRLGLERPVNPRWRRLKGPIERRWGTRPNARSLGIGALFMVGSLCFALGSLPLYFDSVSGAVTAWTFFVGSVFFTSAAYLQFQEAVAAPLGVTHDSTRPGPLARLVNWTPHRIDWWATAVQFAGTLMFNVTTFAATRSGLSLEQDKHLIWAPDVGGSICFLVASWFAYSEVNAGIRPRTDHSTGWWISALNMVGSIAFGVAAIAARYQGDDGEVANLALVNLGTFVGAVCFFVGAALLPVESARDTSEGALAAANRADG